MTIVEKNSIDSPWLFRTQPLQTAATPSMREVALELAKPPTPVPGGMPHHPMPPSKALPQPKQQSVSQVSAPPPPPPPPLASTSAQMASNQPQQEQEQQRIQQSLHQRIRVPSGPIPIDPKKVVKSSTAPNLPTSNSLSEMFRVI